MDMQETSKTEEDAGAVPAAEETQAEMEMGIDVEEIEDFGAVLAAYEAASSVIKEGEVVKGRVIRLMEKDVVIDIGYKSEGVIPLAEFGEHADIDIGDEVEVLLYDDEPWEAPA